MQPISNYFNGLLAGIGHRGSSFTDIDAVTHDGHTGRWLLQEFKGPTESVDKSQDWHMGAIAEQPRFTSWLVRRLGGGRIGWRSYAPGATAYEEVITEDEYRSRFRQWWNATNTEAA